ncbi:hypothetical protein Tco_0712149 [Tanacetum coccineum]
MDLITPLGQKNTLVEYMILFGAENHPPMLDKDLYDSWKSRMELYMQNRDHGRMILESVEHGPLIWPTIEENGVTRTKKYVELSATEKIQDDDDLIGCLNKAMAFLTVVASLQFPSTNNQLRTSSNLRNQATIQDGRVMLLVLGEAMQVDRQGLLNATIVKTKDIDTYDSDCDDLSNAQAALMANISNYGSNVISEATVQDTNLQAQQDSMILSVIEKMPKQMINHVNNWEKANKEHINESVTAELKRYKERVKTFEQRLYIDLSSREKMIDSQMDEMIKEKLALKEQVDSLEQNLSRQIKEKESLLKTFAVSKTNPKKKKINTRKTKLIWKKG